MARMPPGPNCRVPQYLQKIVYKGASSCPDCGRPKSELKKEAQKNNYPVNKRHGMTIDHILPRSKGGTNDLANLRPLCWPCNLAKGDLSPE